MKFGFRKLFRYFVMIRTLKWSFMIIIKDPFFFRPRNWLFEFRSDSIEHTSKRRALWLSLTLCETPLSSCFYLANFLERIQYCLNADIHCLRHFSDTLTFFFFWQVFSDVGSPFQCDAIDDVISIRKLKINRTLITLHELHHIDLKEYANNKNEMLITRKKQNLYLYSLKIYT